MTVFEIMNKPINSEIVVAHSQCLRKAYLLLCTKTKGTPHEYMLILEEEKNANRERYLQKVASKASAQPYNGILKGGSDFVSNAMLMTDDLEATCDLLTKVDGKSALGRYRYEPTIVVGTHSISKAQRLRLFFDGYVLGKAQNRFPESGRIIDASGKSHKIKLENREDAFLLVLSNGPCCRDSIQQAKVILPLSFRSAQALKLAGRTMLVENNGWRLHIRSLLPFP